MLRSALGTWFGNVVVGLAQRAAGSSAREPGIEATSMKGMSTGQATHFVLVVKIVDANGASIARLFKKLWCDGRLDMLVVFVVIIGRVGSVASVNGAAVLAGLFRHGDIEGFLRRAGGGGLMLLID